ncbi:serine hydrolase [Prochlorothrix hollandica]|uniref:Beta-lactamase superfamily protein n=1 Tax=Prochlorothrix hollandica PCC 9006 = CALU 1027 TaxID=317619 RepID=A0A0M2PVN4_PROHO|nr:serine hydrolase [Prochlorothrix hollandica]KKI99157.1 beta-lactamase superfamily protein [Prochlorothrix hollandica PCC 9006 = CALU 1027]
MNFFQSSPQLQTIGDRLCDRTWQQFPSLQRHQLALTWLVYNPSLGLRATAETPVAPASQPQGYHYRGDLPIYPASVVKLVYLVAYYHWLDQGKVPRDPELERAVRDMIVDSSNDATGYVLDVLTTTTSGPPLDDLAWIQWQHQRNAINRYVAGWRWSQWAGCNANQKTWCDGPYGRERRFLGPDLSNRNRLNTLVSARLVHNIVTGALVSPAACGEMVSLLRRSLDPADLAADPENQVTGFLGAGVPRTATVWSKAGLTSQVRHDAAYVELEGDGPSFLLVAFTEGREHSNNEEILPFIAREAVAAVADIKP